MGLKLSAVRILSRPARLTLSAALHRRLGCQGQHRALLSFGVKGAWVYLDVDATLPPGEIALSEAVRDALLLPQGIPLEIEAEGRGLRFGPLVGMLLNKRGSYLSETLRTVPATYTTPRLGTITTHTPIGLFGYVERYEDFGGVVVFFGLDDLDPVTQTLDGWVYEPASKGFVRLKLPWPRALYRKAGLSETWKASFASVLQDGLYNNYFADKWEVARWLMEDEDLKARVPETALYRGFGDLLQMLGAHGMLFAKPIDGMGGYGVIQISREAGEILFEYRKDGANERLRAPEAEAGDAFEGLKGKRTYLIQRGLKLKRFEGGVIDIRVPCLKDQGGRWQGMGIVIRKGADGSVVSNISSDGIAFTMDELFGERYGWPDPEVRHMEARLYALSRRVCQRLEEAGLHLGYCGVDVGVTDDGQLFIIEVNLRDPDSTIALDVNDTELYHRLKVGPLVYGKGLDGFKGPGEAP